MPILDIQQRTRELGRIRIGQVQPTKSGRSRPAKLDRFRLTSASKPLLEQVAELYGGTVREWTPANGGPSAWEVVTDADRLPVMVPPRSVTQWYELWSGGGCQRRCDGQREVLTDAPCPCGPDPAARECKPTTRLNVVLRDVPGVGVWRLESHGYYAAVELPAVADMLAQTSGYIRAWLALEERTAKREGQTRRWMVPTLEVDATPAELMSGTAPAAAPVPAGQAREVAGTTAAAIGPARDWRGEVASATTADQVRELYRACVTDGAMDQTLSELMRDRVTALDQAAEEIPAVAPAPVDDGQDVDELWMRCVSVWSGSTTELVDAYAANHGGELPGNASGAQLSAFLADIKAGRVTAPGEGSAQGVPF